MTWAALYTIDYIDAAENCPSPTLSDIRRRVADEKTAKRRRQSLGSSRHTIISHHSDKLNVTLLFSFAFVNFALFNSANHPDN
jgi:hypothetical protein